MMAANYIEEYYGEICTGTIQAGEWIKALYERVLADLKAGHYFYDARKASKVIRFIEDFCHHSKGRSDLITLELWQKASLALIFGIVDADGRRHFKEVVLIVARKNGKSLIAAAIIAYLVYIDDEYGAEVYCLAPKLDQARIVYDNFYEIVRKEPELLEISQKRRTDIYIDETNSSVKPIAFSAKKSDGYNPHGVINDEFASWIGDKGLKQYEVMKSAVGARRQALIFSISTAGYEDNGIYDELFTRGTAWLKGSSRENRLLPIFYMVDDPDRWDCIEELQKANPNMGVSVPESFFLDEIAVAYGSLSKKGEFLTKYCNVKQNSSVAWWEAKYITAAMEGAEELTLGDFYRCYAVGGVDLSKTTDLTAACVMIERDGITYTFCQFFIPSSQLRYLQERDGVPYDIFVKRGIITLSGKNAVDYRDLFNWYVELVQKYKIYVQQIGYDRYSATYLVNDLKEYGFHVDDVNQGYNLSPVIDEFEGIVKDGKFKIAGKNDLLAAHLLNVALKNDAETRKNKPVKIEQRAHIDGAVSVLDAWTVRQKYYQEIGELLKNPRRNE